jgi:hypothetical protein
MAFFKSVQAHEVPHYCQNMIIPYKMKEVNKTSIL